MTHWRTSRELAEQARTTEATVRYWRHIGYGPPGVRVGKRVLYDQVDIDAWFVKLRQEQNAG